MPVMEALTVDDLIEIVGHTCSYGDKEEAWDKCDVPSGSEGSLQWFVEEQIEEESLFSTILDKLNLLGGDKARMYMFDKEMENLAVQQTVAE